MADGQSARIRTSGQAVFGAAVGDNPYNRRPASARGRDHANSTSKWLSAGQEYICGGRADDVCDAVPQVSCSIWNAKGDPATFAVAGWTAAGGILGLLHAVEGGLGLVNERASRSEP